MNAPVNAPVNVSTNSLGTLTPTQQEILALIKENVLITYDEMCSYLGKNRVTIRRAVKNLRDKKILKRNDSDKKGYWEINKKNKRNVNHFFF